MWPGLYLWIKEYRDFLRERKTETDRMQDNNCCEEDMHGRESLIERGRARMPESEWGGRVSERGERKRKGRKQQAPLFTQRDTSDFTSQPSRSRTLSPTLHSRPPSGSPYQVSLISTTLQHNLSQTRLFFYVSPQRTAHKSKRHVRAGVNVCNSCSQFESDSLESFWRVWT